MAKYTGDDTRNILNGSSGNDVLRGKGGDDDLHGGDGNDTLDGGTGNDSLYGGNGADTYLFSPGSGEDIIFYEALGVKNADSIKFGATVKPQDITLSRTDYAWYDLVISLNGTSDSLYVQDYFSETIDHTVDNLVFADGTNWNIDTVKAKLIQSSSGDDLLYGYQSNDTLSGGDGNDMIYGLLGNDKISGDSGDDYLDGNEGDDKLDGGTGNDILVGGSGANTYLFGPGSGQDRIVNGYTYEALDVDADTIQFGATVKPQDITLSRSGYYSLVISLNGTTDYLTVQDYFSQDTTTNCAVANLRFADGTNWNIDTVKAKLAQAISGDDYLIGSAGNDYLYGGDGNDTLLGGSGIDALDGGNGNDTLDGGADNDHLRGEDGADTYLFGLGSGQDTIMNGDTDTLGSKADIIKFGTTLKPEDVTLSRLEYNNLLISLNGTSDQLIVEYYFIQDATSPYAVENLLFADGTNLDINTVKTKVLQSTSGDDILYGYAGDDTLSGGDGNDELYGRDGNDTLDGGTGNDLLSGDNGADTYLFGLGYGQDIIHNWDTDELGTNPDTIQFGQTITPNNIRLSRSGYDLIISLNGTTDQLTVSYYFNLDTTTNAAVNNLRFADGTNWDINTVKAKVLQSSSGDDKLYGYSSDDTLSGGDGNDELYGDDGNDTLDGGKGNDFLSGDKGADTYIFGLGSGQDTIMNRDNDALGINADTIQFGATITPQDVTLSRSGSWDLLISLKGTTDQLTVSYYFTSSYIDNGSIYLDAKTPDAVENLRFADGTIWDVRTVKAIMANNPDFTISGADKVNKNQPYQLTLGPITNPGQSGNEIIVNWGDGKQDSYNQSGTVSHVYDDGPVIWPISVDFKIGSVIHSHIADKKVAVFNTETLGNAPTKVSKANPNAWINAWSADDISISHKANADSTKSWSPVTLNDKTNSKLSGGDLYAGDLGVSGQTLASSKVKQEIDGTEALRFSLTHLAHEANINFSRLFANDDSVQGHNEAGRLQAFNNGSLVGEMVFQGDNANGKKSITLDVNQGFDSLVFTAGAYDGSNQFISGAYSDGSVDNHHGSDYLIDMVLIGVKPDDFTF